MSLVAILCLLAAVNQSGLTADEAKTVRQAAYDGPLLLFAPERPGGLPVAEEVTVPTSLIALHRRKPLAVTKLLLAVVEGGRPIDSVRAAAYALALWDRPSAGAMPLRHYDEESYDSPGSDRINSRDGWASAVRSKLVVNQVAVHPR